jgi:hypothetical protein
MQTHAHAHAHAHAHTHTHTHTQTVTRRIALTCATFSSFSTIHPSDPSTLIEQHEAFNGQSLSHATRPHRRSSLLQGDSVPAVSMPLYLLSSNFYLYIRHSTEPIQTWNKTRRSVSHRQRLPDGLEFGRSYISTMSSLYIVLRRSTLGVVFSLVFIHLVLRSLVIHHFVNQLS